MRAVAPGYRCTFHSLGELWSQWAFKVHPLGSIEIAYEAK